MIQRIQSIYLLLSTVLIAIATALPLMSFISMIDTCTLSAFSLVATNAAGELSMVRLWSLGILFCVTALLTFVVIFLFKKRKLQIKLTHYAFIMKIAILAVVAFYTFQLQVADESKFSPELGLLFVPIAMVLDWLAIKAIRKDEDLVRSIDRIR